MAERPKQPHFYRLFTHEEATALLPKLRTRLHDLAAMKRRLDDVQREFNAIQQHARSNGHAARAQALGAELESLVHNLNTAVAAIQALGIDVKDLDSGLVDFPERARRARRLSLLANGRTRYRRLARIGRWLHGSPGALNCIPERIAHTRREAFCPPHTLYRMGAM